MTRWLRDHAATLSQEASETLKRRMKQVIQTVDPRTVHRRLRQLALHALAPSCDLDTWISRTRERLPQLLPALRRNAYPRTTNSIARFFRAFQRFYTTRTGFHSVGSAIRETLVLVVVYVFTIQVSTGTAPIEQVVPEARHMPFYKLVNNPFRYGLINRCQANPDAGGSLATQRELLERKQT